VRDQPAPRFLGAQGFTRALRRPIIPAMRSRIVHRSLLLVALALTPGTAGAGALAVPLPELAAQVAGEAPSAPAGDLPAEERRAWQTGLLRPDRLQHTSLAMTSGLMIGATTREPVWAATGAMTLGLAKEFMDIGGTGFDAVDLVADLIGALASAAATSLMTR